MPKTTRNIKLMTHILQTPNNSIRILKASTTFHNLYNEIVKIKVSKNRTASQTAMKDLAV